MLEKSFELLILDFTYFPRKVDKTLLFLNSNSSQNWNNGGKLYGIFVYVATASLSDIDSDNFFRKVNSVQEACAKYFSVHIVSRFEILQTTWKNKTHKNARFID